ncbi:MAG: histidine kinase [Deltaproteobacteria bacterium HGW-Deltaproteobacteria-14]|jgi:predicted nicotinamide N-methyase|nr:MAG: histidine kinase [Deltaproteobacteria bacterium HGW-Deltaproteobacteria-14]
MTSLRLRYQTLELEGIDIHLSTLWDTAQFEDDDGAAAAVGICAASWPLFGVVWASGRVLANLMVDFDVAHKRVLEIGCGIALASLVLQHRAADITATDHHPAVGVFLARNVALNGGPAIPFVRTGWDEPDCGMGRFDLIIGSDLLYERDHAASLSAFIERHARPSCDIVIVDPGRGSGGRFSRLMVDLGFTAGRGVPAPVDNVAPGYGGQILVYSRHPAALT